MSHKEQSLDSSRNTTLSSILTELQQASRPSTVPNTATPFSAVNGTALAAAATPQAVKAAVAGKKHYITECIAVNITTGEDAVTFLQDEDDTLHAVLCPADAGAVTKDPNAGKYTFSPPLEIAAGKAIEIHVGSATDLGDVHVSVNGYVEA